MASKKNIFRKAKALFFILRRKRINQNVLIYLVMVMVTAIFWLINKTGSNINTIATFQVEYYGLPHNRVLVPGLTTQELRINCSARGTSLLGHHGIYSPIRLDLAKLDIRTFPESDSSLKFVTGDDIRPQVEAQLPADFKFLSLKPDTIKLDFGLSSHKRVPVIFNHEIGFAQQFRLAKQPALQPDSVDISGSANIVDTVEAIQTEKLVISKLNESQSHKVRLNIPNGINCSLTATDVNITVEKFTEQTITVPIRQINVPDTVTLRIFSQNVKLRFNVGWNNYKKITPEMFTVIADYNDLTGIVRPKYLPIQITKKPENMGVTNITSIPESVEYLIERVEKRE